MQRGGGAAAEGVKSVAASTSHSAAAVRLQHLQTGTYHPSTLQLGQLMSSTDISQYCFPVDSWYGIFGHTRLYW